MAQPCLKSAANNLLFQKISSPLLSQQQPLLGLIQTLMLLSVWAAWVPLKFQRQPITQLSRLIMRQSSPQKSRRTPKFLSAPTIGCTTDYGSGLSVNLDFQTIHRVTQCRFICGQ